MTFSQFFAANWFLFTLLFIVLIAIFIYEMKNKGKSSSLLTNITAATFINNGAVLIDLRPVAEFRKGHIAGAKNIPVEKLADWAATYEHKTQSVVLYCQNGLTARTKVKTLEDNGFTDVYVLKEGVAGWVMENLPLV